MTQTQDMLSTLQRNQAAWQKANEPRFGVAQPRQMLLGVGEEFGEMQHAILKREQNIRGTAEEHQRNIEDAIGDQLIYLCGYANASSSGLLEFQIHVMKPSVDFLMGDAHRFLARMWADVTDATDGLPGNPVFHSSSFLMVLNEISKKLTGKTALHWGTTVFAKVVSKRDWKANPETGIAKE